MTPTEWNALPAEGTAQSADEGDAALWHFPIADAVLKVQAVAVSEPGRAVFDLLNAQPDWPAVAVLNADGKVAGLVSRHHCASVFSKPLALDIYSKRPVRLLMDAAPLVVQIGDTIDTVSRRIEEDFKHALLDGFVVVDGETYAGLVSVQSFMAVSAAQSRQRTAIMERAQASLVAQRRELLDANESLTRAKEEIQRSQDQIQALLDHSGQGFLSFGPDFTVDPQYSQACDALLGGCPTGRPMAELLFPDDAASGELLRSVCAKAFAERNLTMREIFLSLLPAEVTRMGMNLRVQYKPLADGHIMLVLTDITEQCRLEDLAAHEKQILQMVVFAVSNNRDFFETIEDFRELCREARSGELARQQLPELYRHIHTFKGLFSQMSFEALPAALHDVEECLRRWLDGGGPGGVAPSIFPDELERALSADLDQIYATLGPAFLQRQATVVLPADQVRRLESVVAGLLGGRPVELDRDRLHDLWRSVASARLMSLKDALSKFDRVVQQVAHRLDKAVEPPVVEGPDILVDPETFTELLRALVHIFRNAVAHGIERPDDRLQSGKPEAGRITCRLSADGPALSLSIADDGGGIDIDRLRRRVIAAGLGESRAELPEDQLIQLIFLDNLSTADSVDQISGRGIGLAAVQQAVEALGGGISVQTTRGAGTTFTIQLPYPADPLIEEHCE